MDHAIVSSLLLLALAALANMQVIYEDYRWDKIPLLFRETLSSKSVHDRKARDTGASASNNGTYSIESGVEAGICLNVTTKKEIKYEVRRKSYLNYSHKPGCDRISIMDCIKTQLQYKNEVVPEEQLVKVREPFCCDGYIQVANRSSGSNEEIKYISQSWPHGDIYCKPICQPPCINGHCIAANTCGCPKEMVLLEDGRTCETPKCDPECLNSDCVGHNSCKCHRNYVKEEGEPNICMPYCAAPCKKNSYCYSPNECRCQKGYRRDWMSECVSLCQMACENGFCSGKNKCTCLDGYKMVIGSSNKCEPACENCTNGVCTAPEVCKCNNLYKYDEKLKGCIPNCHVNCTMGCDVPMKCNDCNEGYKRSNGSLHCEPECKGCTNGKCLAPGECLCQEGYTRDSNDTECIPKCYPPCKNGICSAPDTCSCLKGYKRANDSLHCEPECKGCTNGKCLAPGECLCQEGYTHDSNDTECIPKCYPPCKNGICSALNTCSCLKGYKRANDSLHCEPECEGCTNGKCLAPGECLCQEGYTRDSNDTECIPKCYPQCKNGICSAPNTCSCLKGYKRVNDSLHCEPECKGCTNGKCFAPGVCVCQEGYTRDSNDTECIPRCRTPCKNGVCSAPKTCSCFKGYHLSNNVCESDTVSCKKPIEDKINGSPHTYDCVNVDEQLRMYTENCTTHFTNSSCFDEYCTNSENHPICRNMQYRCEFIHVLRWGLPHIDSSQLQCRWRNSKIIEVNTTSSVRIESSTTTIAAEDSRTNIQDDNLPLFFFRPDFDTRPCLLCLCPVHKQRNFCLNGTYSFKLCPCPEKASMAEDEKADYFRSDQAFYYILYAVCLISLVLTIIAVKIKCSAMKPDSESYTVSSFNNDLYCEGNRFEEAEHVYAEIESDGYEQPTACPKNLILSF